MPTMKEYLEGVIARCDATLAELREKNEKAQSVEELRSITERIESVMTERGAAQEALAGQMNIEPEERGGFNPVATYGDLQSVKRTEGGRGRPLLHGVPYRLHELRSEGNDVRHPHACRRAGCHRGPWNPSP